MNLRRAGWLPSWFLLATSALPAAAASVRFVDDRLKPVEAPLEVCSVVGLSSDCRSVEAGSPYELPDQVRQITVEGSAHGPVIWKPEASSGATAATIVVPRKAMLRLRGRVGDLTISLYPVADPGFRRPIARGSPGAASQLLVPSGDFLVSAAEKGQAPDLHLMKLLPGETSVLTYTARPGWSAVVRVRGSGKAAPLVGAHVRFAAANETASGTGEREVVTALGGLAIANGLTVGVARAAVSSQEFVPTLVPAIVADPGSFAFEEVELQLPGRLSVTVTEADKPVSGARCRLLPRGPRFGPGAVREPEAVAEAATDVHGQCGFSRLAAGDYVVELEPGDGRGRVAREVTVASGELAELQVALELIEVSGTVSRGGSPAAGFEISFHLLSAATALGPGSRPVKAPQAKTDEEGKYSLTVLERGEFLILATTPLGTPVGMPAKRVTLEAPHETVDLELPAGLLRGQVLAARTSKPLAEVHVLVRRAGEGALAAVTGGDGRFEVIVGEAAWVEIYATKRGFRRSELVVVDMAKEVAPNLTILLEESLTVEGRVVTASQAPVPSAWVVSSGVGASARGFSPTLGAGESDAAGRFSVPRAPAGVTRLFAGSVSCPLTAVDAIAEAETETVVVCPSAMANLSVRFHDENGGPRAGQALFLRRSGVTIPALAVERQLGAFGLRPASDGQGRLLLVGLSPGEYQLFLAGASSEATIEAGALAGLVATRTLGPGETAEVEVELVRPK